MAIKRKPAPKPTPKPAARPTPKPLPRPKPAPLDLVRSPNFDAAMAQRNYDNFIAEQRTRMGAEQGQPFPPEQATFTPSPQLPPDFQDKIEGRNAALDAARSQYRQGIPTPIPEAPQGATADQYQNPQGQQQQMQSYQNFLNQGMNNMASMNQGAAESFANTQPGIQVPQLGAQTPQPAIVKPQRQGMVTQQRRLITVPRKFSTVSNSPARFA
jgi:hypothetical protein